MIRHIVMWRFKESAEGATRAENVVKFKAMLESCRDLAPGTLHLEVGVAQPGLASTSDLVLVSDFTDQAALDGYQDHPEHVVVKQFATLVVESRQCVDYVV
ncbi:Dabb family protein [Paraburkholderia lycopersici]|uniref:Stress responsive A/B Barrel Domain n=1 Tax=Paraburkholderia lycopersici TaxID=416944 RepID=A0A1G6HNH8_9BURK|nr:Dabb family protein [Paraburkholderia lycopersici]SDB95754.1 Stress responsive A/B Barrel Domain [Paraburkholderia lycopersici]